MTRTFSAVASSPYAEGDGSVPPGCGIGRSPLGVSLLALLVLLLAGCATPATPGPRAVPPAAPSAGMHLFLLAGQSNMAGRGDVEPQDREIHPRIWMLDRSGKWVPAMDPVHYDKPVAGVGPGLTFARELVSTDTSMVVGLVPAAAGGSPISTWEPGAWHDQTDSRPYDDAVSRMRIAQRAGELKAILWHQGESDGNAESAPLYRERLTRLIQRLRSDLDLPEVPFLIGGLGCFPAVPWDRHRATVDSAHRAVPNALPNVLFVSADGLGHKGDHVHFDTDAARELGRRFARAYRSGSGGGAAASACSNTAG